MRVLSITSLLIYFGVLGAVLLHPTGARAYDPVIVAPTSSDTHIMLSDTPMRHWYYGHLEGFPQTYQLSVAATSSYTFAIKELPVKKGGKNTSGIIVRRVARGVREVARLSPSDAPWTTQREPVTGDVYWRGPADTLTLVPGTYLIQVSNGDNLGRYALVVGTDDHWLTHNYFVMLAKVAKVKFFLGEWPISLFRSPLYYLPLGLILLIVAVAWYRKKNVR